MLDNNVKINVLDCTLRDGGHHTNWQFPSKFVERYLSALEDSGVPWVELGYRRPHLTNGPWNHCSDELLEELSLPKALHYAVMIDLKEFIDHDVAKVFKPAQVSKVSMVRIAAHYHHIEHLHAVASKLKSLGYRIAVNLMRSGQVEESVLIKTLEIIEKNSDIEIINFADSYGSMDETLVEKLITLAKSISTKPLGFHAHDNKQLALRNTLKAIELGVQSVDATISGMGKGPGNTAMEFLLVELQKQTTQYKPQALARILKEDFYPLKQKLGWGSDLFSYLAADRSIHPDDIELLRKEL